MRYQIKEAFDKVINIENADPSQLSIESAKPNDITISYQDLIGEKKIYRYSDGYLSVIETEAI